MRFILLNVFEGIVIHKQIGVFELLLFFLKKDNELKAVSFYHVHDYILIMLKKKTYS